jgi:nucleoside-diphosphate-sugar epimerase
VEEKQMKVLFIGGTGLISTAVTKLAIEKGMDLTLLNRGQRSSAFSNQVKQLVCDIYDENAVKEMMKDLHFDAIVDWIAFTVEHVERDYRLFK